MQSDLFQKAYKSLNIEQKRAVDAIDGPVMVIAGPGTGKTSILTLRIANILNKTDTDPSSILALTFTESGAHSMRKKLVGIIGSSAYRVNIFTFHGFCNEIIKKYPEYFPKIIGGTTITEIDQIRILEEVFENESFNILKPFGNIFYYLKPSLSAIKSLKRENIDPDNFKKEIDEQERLFKEIPDLIHEKGKYKGEMKGAYKDVQKKIEKNKELLVVYRAYEKEILEKHYYDYEDMIVETIKALELNPDLLLILQEEYQYILADEHQDANNAQNRILELLSGFHESPNLFIVGDEKQAIYRFQGASLQNFLFFKKKYPQALVIALENNYRSTQIILDASQSLISKNIVQDEGLRIPLKSKGLFEEKKLSVYEFDSEETEARFIAQNVKALLEDNKNPVNPYDIAVLYRDNKDAEILKKAFEHEGLPFAIFSDDNMLHDEELMKLVHLLKAVSSFGDDTLLSKLLFIDFLKLSHLDIYKIIKESRDKKISLFNIIKNRNYLESLELDDSESLITLYEHLHTWSVKAKNRNLGESLEFIIRDSGFLSHLLSLPGSLDKLQKLDGLFSIIKNIVEAHREYKLSDFILYLETLETHNAKISQSSRQSFEHTVVLMTAHKSKGLEFEHVFIFGAISGRWGNKKSPEYFTLPIQGRVLVGSNKDEDERRLFYVALTRAKKAVVVTYANKSPDGKERLRSQFLEDISDDFILNNVVQTEKGLDALFQKSKGYPGVDLKDKEYLQKLFLEQGLNVTAINNFLRCPWVYFFDNLVRIPRVPEKHQMYGTAIHAGLKDFFSQYKKGETPDKDFLIQAFERSLKRQPLADSDFEETLSRGKQALEGYYNKWNSTWGTDVIVEMSIAGVFIPFDSDKTLLLRGQLDKVEKLEGSDVRVIDYKTGKPKSRNDILGETKSSEGNMKRQLDFYRLLLDLYNDGAYTMVSGVIDFIEPNQNGEHKKEEFEITKKDKESIIELTQKVASDIYSLSFWDSFCDDPKCQHCDLRRTMNK